MGEFAKENIGGAGIAPGQIPAPDAAPSSTRQDPQNFDQIKKDTDEANSSFKSVAGTRFENHMHSRGLRTDDWLKLVDPEHLPAAQAEMQKIEARFKELKLLGENETLTAAKRNEIISAMYEAFKTGRKLDLITAQKFTEAMNLLGSVADFIDSNRSEEAEALGQTTGFSRIALDSFRLRDHTDALQRFIRSNFDGIHSISGYRKEVTHDGSHHNGLALDCKVDLSSPKGDNLAEYLIKHADELGIKYVIWKQRIWSKRRAGEGWRAMPDRGSPTDNHFDHVHVTLDDNTSLSQLPALQRAAAQ